MDKLKLQWKLLRRAVLKRWLEFRYRNQDDNVCCCGGYIYERGRKVNCEFPCRSLKEYTIEQELKRLKC